MATYQKDKPEAQDDQDVSQVDLQQNFEANNETWAVDHVSPDPNTNGNRGKHNKVTFVEQSADPSPAVDQGVMYSKDVSSETMPYYTYIKSDSSIGIVPVLPEITAGTNGSFKIGNVAFVWGTVTVAAGGNVTQAISFGSNFSAAPWSLTGGVWGANATYLFDYVFGQPTSTSCDVRFITSTQTRTLNWQAIGPAA